MPNKSTAGNRKLQTLNGNLRRLREWAALAKEAAESAQ